MRVVVSGKQIDVGDSLRGHVESRLNSGVQKYFDNAIDAQVSFSRQGIMFRSDCAVHVGSGIRVQGHAEANEIYAAFDLAADRVEKRLRRYKRRIRDHHKSPPAEAFEAPTYVIAAEPEDHEEPELIEDAQPVVVAEATTMILSLTVGQAVMRLDLENSDAVMFRNQAHGGLNVVYRRSDGNIGWIAPDYANENA